MYGRAEAQLMHCVRYGRAEAQLMYGVRYGRAEAQLMYGATRSNSIFFDLYLSVPHNLYHIAGSESSPALVSLHVAWWKPTSPQSTHIAARQKNNNKKKQTKIKNKLKINKHKK